MDKKELAKTSTCAGANLRMSTRVVTQAFNHALEPSGLTITQFTLLTTLAKRGPLSIGQLGEISEADHTTLTRNLKPLEKQKLIASYAGEDQRTRLVNLTEAGEQKLEQALPLWETVQNKINTTMGQDRYEFFLKELQELTRLLG